MNKPVTYFPVEGRGVFKRGLQPHAGVIEKMQLLFSQQFELLKRKCSKSCRMMNNNKTEQRRVVFHGLTCFIYLYSFGLQTKGTHCFISFFFTSQTCKKMDGAWSGAMKPFCCKHLNQILDVQLYTSVLRTEYWVGPTENIYIHKKKSKCNSRFDDD